MEKVDILFRDEKKLKMNIEELTVEDHYLLKKLISSLQINNEILNKIYKKNKYKYKYYKKKLQDDSSLKVEKILKNIYNRNIDINILTKYYLNFWIQKWFLKDIVDFKIHEIIYVYTESDEWNTLRKESPYCDCNWKIIDFPDFFAESAQEMFNVEILLSKHINEHSDFYYKLYNLEQNYTLTDILERNLIYKNIKLLISYGLNINLLNIDSDFFENRDYYNSINSAILCFNYFDIETIIKKNRHNFKNLFFNYKQIKRLCIIKDDYFRVINIFYIFIDYIEKYCIDIYNDFFLNL
jgi:hypothetical protein